MATVARSTATRLRLALPHGVSLHDDAWRRRHRGIVALLAVHAAALTVFALQVGFRPAHALLEGGVVAAFALVAAWPALGRRTRALLAAGGLMTASAVLVHLSGGYIEAHFHFFVMLGVIFLYEDWVPTSRPSAT